MSIAVPRGGGLAWEYYFNFDGGAPPWVSGLAQGTGAAGDRPLGGQARPPGGAVPAIAAGLKMFEQPTPTGVRVRAADGTQYAQYSFAPGPDDPQRLHPVARRALRRRRHHGRPARRARCSRRATATRAQDVPSFDTGAWSLYSRGTRPRVRPQLPHAAARLPRRALRPHADAGLLRRPRRTSRATSTTPPVLELRRRGCAAGGRASAFSLSKISSASISVTAPGGRTVLSVSAGTRRARTRTVSWKVPRKRRDLHGADLRHRPRGQPRRAPRARSRCSSRSAKRRG